MLNEVASAARYALAILRWPYLLYRFGFSPDGTFAQAWMGMN